MSNVIPLGNITYLDLPADRILECNMGKLDSVILMGYDKTGEFYFSSSLADGGEVLWLIERYKLALLQISLEEDSNK